MADALQTSLRVAASGIHAQSHRIRVASENLANANTTGRTAGAEPYTRKTIAFDNEFDDGLGVNLVRIGRIDEDKAPFRLEYSPDHPAADASGMVKTPNVNMLVEMADIREANRSYEANLQVIKRAREMISMTIDLLRASS